MSCNMNWNNEHTFVMDRFLDAKTTSGKPIENQVSEDNVTTSEHWFPQDR